MSFTEHRISGSSRGEGGDQEMGVQEEKEEIKKVSRGEGGDQESVKRSLSQSG